MNKNSIRWYASLAIITVVYSVVMLVIPFPKGNVVFWLSYLFTMAALGAQIYVMHVAFSKGQDIKSKFYGFPIARIGFCYLVAQFGISSLFIVMETYVAIPVRLPIVLYFVLLGIASIGFISTDIARDETIRQDEKIKENISYMQLLQKKVSFFSGVSEDKSVVQALTKFSENLRFSDPVSAPAIYEAEAKLSDCVDNIQKAIMDNDGEKAIVFIRQAEIALSERNRLCKLNK